MNIVYKSKLNNVVPLFDEWEDIGILSCLQGHIGEVWADDEDVPTVAKIISVGFCYVAGDANSPQARELLHQTPKEFELQVNSETWHKIVEEELADRIYKFTRFQFKRDSSLFDRVRLQSYIQALPKGYEVKQIDEAMFRYLPTLEWADNHCSQFSSFAEFQKYGIGFVVLYEGTPVCAASPYVYSDGAIDIQIDTVENHQRKGIATACAASLILECLRRGIFPNWSADCGESCYLAEKLGYQLEKKFVSYAIIG